MKCIVLWIASMSLVLTAAVQARGGMVFSDDFESLSLSATQWPTNITGAFVAVDPLNSSNHVLDFGGKVGGGDVFSKAFTLTPDVTYTFSWDYLGTLSDAGGFAGLNWGPRGNPATELWVGGTALSGGPVFLLTNDNTWHHYSFDFTTADTAGFTEVEVKFENWDEFGSSLHTALFDNVRVESAPVPEPSSIAMWGVGAIALVFAGRKRRQLKLAA